MKPKKVYKIPIVQKTILEVLVVASSKKEALEITEDENCEWWNEKEEVLDSEKKQPIISKDHHESQYAYFRNDEGVVDGEPIKEILNPTPTE